jgi:glycosyltransferase involved in cell wall biosynthesis
MITVSPSIQDWYRKRFPWVAVTLVRNIPERSPASVVAAPLRSHFNVPNDALLFIFVGGLNRDKGIEKMLAAFSDPRNHHHFVCLGRGPLQSAIKAASRTNPRVHHLPPVPTDSLLSCVAGADVSVCMTEDSCLSRRFSLPNKLFESLLAGVPVIVPPLPDLSAIVRNYCAGWIVSGDASDFAEFIIGLGPDDVRRIRAGLAERVAELGWENEEKALLSVYDSL